MHFSENDVEPRLMPCRWRHHHSLFSIKRRHREVLLQGNGDDQDPHLLPNGDDIFLFYDDEYPTQRQRLRPNPSSSTRQRTKMIPSLLPNVDANLLLIFHKGTLSTEQPKIRPRPVFLTHHPFLMIYIQYTGTTKVLALRGSSKTPTRICRLYTMISQRSFRDEI